MTKNDLIKNKLITSGLYTDCSDAQRKVIAKNAANSKKVLALQSEQWDDGSWGRFHTQNTKLKQKCRTTEMAAFVINWYGLPRGFQITDNLCAYMERLLEDLSLWPDAWEKNKWFKPAVPQFVASRLSLFGSNNNAYKNEVKKCVSILGHGFSNGEYSAEAVDIYASEMLGTPINGSYIGLNSINTISLFANNTDAISNELQSAYIKWLHDSTEKIGYLIISLSQFPDTLNNNSEIDNFLVSMQYLSQFCGFNEEYKKEIGWILSKQDKDGFWDFGDVFGGRKLSNQWRKDIDRKIDHTIFILGILNNCAVDTVF